MLILKCLYFLSRCCQITHVSYIKVCLLFVHESVLVLQQYRVSTLYLVHYLLNIGGSGNTERPENKGSEPPWLITDI